jgi:hypothetical protein
MNAGKMVANVTGKPIPASGQYAAASCCRTLKNLTQGEAFPSCDNRECPKAGTPTLWESVPSGAAIGLTDA